MIAEKCVLMFRVGEGDGSYDSDEGIKLETYQFDLIFGFSDSTKLLNLIESGQFRADRINTTMSTVRVSSLISISCNFH